MSPCGFPTLCVYHPLADGAVVNILTGLSADAGFSFSRVKTWSGGCREVYVYSLRSRGLFSAVAVPFSLPPNRAGVCSIVSPTLRITAPSVRQSDVCWCLIGGFLGDFHMTDNTKRLLCAHHPITLVCSYHPCVSLLGRLSFC